MVIRGRGSPGSIDTRAYRPFLKAPTFTQRAVPTVSSLRGLVDVAAQAQRHVVALEESSAPRPTPTCRCAARPVEAGAARRRVGDEHPGAARRRTDCQPASSSSRASRPVHLERRAEGGRVAAAEAEEADVADRDAPAVQREAALLEPAEHLGAVHVAGTASTRRPAASSGSTTRAASSAPPRWVRSPTSTRRRRRGSRRGRSPSPLPPHGCRKGRGGAWT